LQKTLNYNIINIYFWQEQKNPLKLGSNMYKQWTSCEEKQLDKIIAVL